MVFFWMAYNVKISRRSNVKWSNSFLQVHYCRFENLSICLCSSKNDTPEISHYCSQQLSSYSPVKFAFFLKSRLLQRILLFMYICKQTFRNLYGWITREFLALRRRNFQDFILISIRIHIEIFKSALAYL